MSVLNQNSDDEPQECPLCMEFLELDDISFYPCSCGYQICRFCWNKIRTEGSGLCPACRSPYSENPADFKPLTAEELSKIKAEKRLKDQAKKQKISNDRKHLANVRVVQRNLVFVVGLSPRLADPDILKKPEYFGKFGKIHKVVINHSTSYAGNQNQGPSASAYVTYYKSEDTLRAIQAVNNIFIDGRTLKASLGTTKYCSHFMKNQTCPKHDCMYLHELGDEAASFTKEEMQQGKHTDYERALHENILMQSAVEPAERGLEVNKKENASSRSPSPKETWPNLATNAMQTYAETNGTDGSSQQENEPLPLGENLSPEEESPETPQDLECLNHWSRPSTSNSPPPDFSEEDDLGFDPFHETQKAMAEMLETESKMVQIKPVQQASRAEQPSHLGQMHSPGHQLGQQQLTTGRSKAPPPGFTVSSNIHTGLQHRFPGMGGFESLSSHMLHSNQGFPSNDFDLNNHLGKSFQDPAGHGFRNSFSNSGSNVTSWHGKDWQDGLRALLPNVNVSFGNMPNNYQTQQQQQQQQQQMESRSPNVNLQQFHREEMELNSRQMQGGWNSMMGNDWTVLDPAIVGGQMANSRPESPANWIKTNLEQLTSDTQSSYSSKSVSGGVLPGFSNMAINSSSSSSPRHLSSQHWGGGQGASNMSGAPPPGFATNRGQIPHSFQNISSLNTNSDGHQIEI